MIPTDFLRGLNESMMPDSAAIQRLTETASGDGTSESWATVATVACRLSPNGSAATEALGAGLSVRSAANWRVALPAGTDVRSSDRLVINARTFEVAGVLGGRSYATQTTAICTELT